MRRGPSVGPRPGQYAPHPYQYAPRRLDLHGGWYEAAVVSGLGGRADAKQAGDDPQIRLGFQVEEQVSGVPETKRLTFAVRPSPIGYLPFHSSARTPAPAAR